ncbi:GNAT family N-acetyltransferase [Streptomyces goshikiensis]|uniref:GNAT family N-acetyltransferase n=1 Tax=Streptomyces TaxID=1883 RepID=UPI00093ABF3D|nr:MULTISPECIES: GNAT family N-acetyltransferase [Streptomyces]MBP0936113.1 GNAT family N-acetyltransferase [Streptomyces sp. KCTC 0041BP]OKI35330.1 acetyltransferase [Streptomyces sp. CB03578]WBY21916.1 GNAT family N-acetyltransferase [Streptomyces goshikiensis]WSS00701.1 GNAT family N-acetyltransferase [Streptomyces goshikiensis]WSX98258.1 GNAT family N-acetyltransferase [Streptomyces goshikiensis]
MEITAGGLLEIRITPADVGKRVSVRRVDPGRGGPPGFSDAVGVLTSWNEGVLVITQKNAKTVRIAESSLVAGKVVPAAPARRRGPAASFEELARITARAWVPLESEPLGEWVLRASGGFTRRANSVLPIGDPGVPLDEALARVTSWYAERGLPAYVQAATGAVGTQEALCAELEARGWVNEVSAEVRVGALAPVGDLDAAAADDVRLTRVPDEEWLARYGRVRDPGPARRMLVEGPSVWFATLPGRAIGRMVTDGRWAGFGAVEVDPEHRRGGLATAVMAALARRALEEGASAAWLQVEADNPGARGLYDGMGFTTHHMYHHFRAAA